MKQFLLAMLALIATPAEAQSHPFDHLAAELADNFSLTDVSAWDGLELDVRYATAENFTHQNVYGPFHSCFVHSDVSARLRRVLEAIATKKPGWKLRAFDCLRPVRAQVKLFAVVKGTPEQKYVLDPAFGSLHSYGFAMDVSLSDETGREVDMGTGFDFFGIEAEPQHEAELLKAGRLNQAQLAHRQLLRSFMSAGGFRAISTEWWHFDALDGATVRAKYPQIP